MMWGNILRMCAKYCTPSFSLSSAWLNPSLFPVAPGSTLTDARKQKARHGVVNHWLPTTMGCEATRKTALPPQLGLLPSLHVGNQRTIAKSLPAVAVCFCDARIQTCSVACYTAHGRSPKTRTYHDETPGNAEHLTPVWSSPPNLCPQAPINLAPGYPRHFRLLFLLGLSHCVGQKMSIPLLSRINAANLLQGFQLTA